MENYKRTIIGALSDIHGAFRDFTYKRTENDWEGNIELLIIAGDLCNFDDPKEQEQELRQYWKPFLASFPSLQKVILVPGNHDFWIYQNYTSDPKMFDVFGGLTKVLIDQSYTYQSECDSLISFYGCPNTRLQSFAFPGDFKELPRYGVDILVTHEAPRNYNLPCITEAVGYLPGSESLAQKVEHLKPRYHIFGHIHRNSGWYDEAKDIQYINVSLSGDVPGGLHHVANHISIIEYRD